MGIRIAHANRQEADVAYTNDELKRHYDKLPDEGGYDSVCDMRIQFPRSLSGRTVVNIGCRRGKGAYHFSDRVGSDGRIIGIDWRPHFIEAARAGEVRALEKGGLTESNMRFVITYPENLDAVDVEAGSVDVVYTNSVLNLTRDPELVLKQACSLLKPGGLFAMRTVVAVTPRDASVVKRAREIGNAIQAAPHRKDLLAWVGSAGFDITHFDLVDQGRILPDQGPEDDPAPTVATDEQASFILADVFARKPDGYDRHRDSLRRDISEFR